MKWIPRQTRRHHVHLEVVEINGIPVSEAYLLDISPMGTLMEAPFALSPGDQVVFNFFLPDEETATRLEGRVAWVVEAETVPGRHRMGLHFSKPNWWLPPACIRTLKVAEIGFGGESSQNLIANNIQALEQFTGVVGKLTAEIQDLRQQVAQLRSEIQDLRHSAG